MTSLKLQFKSLAVVLGVLLSLILLSFVGPAFESLVLVIYKGSLWVSVHTISFVIRFALNG